MDSKGARHSSFLPNFLKWRKFESNFPGAPGTPRMEGVINTAHTRATGGLLGVLAWPHGNIAAATASARYDTTQRRRLLLMLLLHL